MFEQLNNLETVIMKLKQSNSLFDCMCARYFTASEPDSQYLEASYTDCVNIIEILRDSVSDQTEILVENVRELHKIRNELKETGNMDLLVGGITNG